jgi:hypothetical protein
MLALSPESDRLKVERDLALLTGKKPWRAKRTPTRLVA